MIDRVHHIGTVVRSADAALAFYRDALGLPLVDDLTLGDGRLRALLLAAGENEIEIFEPIAGDGMHARHLRERGESIHHVCFATDDVDAEVARLKRQGVRLQQQEPITGITGRIVFVEPAETHGVLVEFAEPFPGAERRRAKGFDHLATLVADLDSATRTWSEVVGLEVASEHAVPAHGAIVRRLRAGQCTIDLIAPASRDGKVTRALAEGGERALSLVAFETADLDAEIGRWREAGVPIGDAEPGPVAGSTRAAIPATRACGLRVEFVQYA